MFLMKKSKYLITGSSSGLGKYLQYQLGGISFNRNSTNIEETEILIHCAFNQTKEVTSKNLYQYLFDNVFLTKKLAKIPHKKFIFISSVDVYQKIAGPHTEEEDISLASITNLYAATKLMSESIVIKMCPDYLILRCVALLGIYSRQSSLIKIAEVENPVLTLAASSVMNYVRHSQVADFIKYAVENNLRGVYNVASTENITLGHVADLLKKKARFGSYQYIVGDISNRKISSVFPSFVSSSEDIVREFIKEDLPKRKIHTKVPIS